MTPARLIRALFPKPLMVSEWSGQSVERYIMIDEPGAETYTLPSFECSYVFVIQGSGQRTIILKPSKECSRDCRTISIVLKPSYVCEYLFLYHFLYAFYFKACLLFLLPVLVSRPNVCLFQLLACKLLNLHFLVLHE